MDFQILSVKYVPGANGKNFAMVSGSLKEVPGLPSEGMTTNITRILPGLDAKSEVGDLMFYDKSMTRDGAGLSPSFENISDLLGSDILGGAFWFGRQADIDKVYEKFMVIYEKMLIETSTDFMQRCWDEDMSLVRYAFDGDRALLMLYADMSGSHNALDVSVLVAGVLSGKFGSEINDYNVLEVLDSAKEEVFWSRDKLSYVDSQQAMNMTDDCVTLLMRYLKAGYPFREIHCGS